MKIADYKSLIINLPVRQQCFTTKKSTWARETKTGSYVGCLTDKNSKLFENKESITISRQDIFNSKNDIEEFILKTLYWGYPRGMQGVSVPSMLGNSYCEKLKTHLSQLRDFPKLDNEEKLRDTQSVFNKITGANLSTYSKFLYFLGVRVNESECLILDQRIIDVCSQSIFEELEPLKNIKTKELASSNYLKYLQIMNLFAKDLSPNLLPENIEQFLFMFGRNLKEYF